MQKKQHLRCKICRGANCDSDHMLVGVRIKQKISKYFGHQNKMHIKKWDVDKLQDKNIKL